MAAGWALVAAGYSHGAPDDAWGAPVIAGGNQRAVETCFMQTDAAAKAAVTSPVTLVTKLAWGLSMGCQNMLVACRYETGVATFVGLYGCCGVFSLADLYAGAHTGHINTAYNIPTGGTYAAQTSGRDPNLATATQNVGPTGATRFRHMFSAGDETCRPDFNAGPFITNLLGVSGVMEAATVAAPDNSAHITGHTTDAIGAADFIYFGNRALAGTDATAPAIPAAPTSVAGTLTATQNQITWPTAMQPSPNIKGWNVYLGGVKQNGSVILRDMTGAWLHISGNTASSTTWTDTVAAPFVAAHVGQPFYGNHVPERTTIAAVVSASQITLSQVTTATDNTLSRLRYVAPLPLYTITGLTASTAYTATVRSVNFDGIESADSPSVAFTTPAAPVGPSLVQRVLSATSATTTTRTATFPSSGTATAGNLLVAFFMTKNVTDATPVAPTGWTAVDTPMLFGSVGYVFMFYKVAAGGETGTTLSWTTASLSALIVEEWTGTTATPFDTTTKSSTNGGTPAVATKIATEGAIPTTVRSVSFSMMGTGGASGAVNAPPAGWTRELTDASGGSKGLFVASRVYTTTPGAAPTITETWATAQRVGTVIASFKGT